LRPFERGEVFPISSPSLRLPETKGKQMAKINLTTTIPGPSTARDKAFLIGAIATDVPVGFPSHATGAAEALAERIMGEIDLLNAATLRKYTLALSSDSP
jgi:hypothetical protein